MPGASFSFQELREADRDDITTFIRYIRVEYPQLLLFLGGHLSGVAQALNYASQADHEPVTGHVFLSLQLGGRAHIDRLSRAAPFARLDGSAFEANRRARRRPSGGASVKSVHTYHGR